MASLWKRWGWRIVKAALALAILFAIGWQFYHDLGRPELALVQFRWPWIILAGIVYLLGLVGFAWFWHRLLQAFGQKPRWFISLRAYFIGHLGKYVPGKAWALLMRGSLVRGPDVQMGPAIITALYETLTTMATGALIAALVFLIDPPPFGDLGWEPFWIGVLLLCVIVPPLIPAVFNRLTVWVAGRLPNPSEEAMPVLGGRHLAEGLLLTGTGWSLMGLSLWALLQGVLPAPPPLTLSLWAHCCGILGIAYVAGFLALVLPSGVGVREFFLRELLAFTSPHQAVVTAAVLLLRLVWTAAEAILAGVLLLTIQRKFRVAKQPAP